MFTPVHSAPSLASISEEMDSENNNLRNEVDNNSNRHSIHNGRTLNNSDINTTKNSDNNIVGDNNSIGFYDKDHWIKDYLNIDENLDEDNHSYQNVCKKYYRGLNNNTEYSIPRHSKDFSVQNTPTKSMSAYSLNETTSTSVNGDFGNSVQKPERREDKPRSWSSHEDLRCYPRRQGNYSINSCHGNRIWRRSSVSGCSDAPNRPPTTVNFQRRFSTSIVHDLNTQDNSRSRSGSPNSHSSCSNLMHGNGCDHHKNITPGISKIDSSGLSRGSIPDGVVSSQLNTLLLDPLSKRHHGHISWDYLLKTIGISSSMCSLTSLDEEGEKGDEEEKDNDVFYSPEHQEVSCVISHKGNSFNKPPFSKAGRSMSFSYGNSPQSPEKLQFDINLQNRLEGVTSDQNGSHLDNNTPISCSGKTFHPIMRRASMQCEAVLTHSSFAKRIVNPIKDVDINKLTRPGPLHAVMLQYTSRQIKEVPENEQIKVNIPNSYKKLNHEDERKHLSIIDSPIGENDNDLKNTVLNKQQIKDIRSHSNEEIKVTKHNELAISNTSASKIVNNNDPNFSMGSSDPCYKRTPEENSPGYDMNKNGTQTTLSKQVQRHKSSNDYDIGIDPKEEIKESISISRAECNKSTEKAIQCCDRASTSDGFSKDVPASHLEPSAPFVKFITDEKSITNNKRQVMVQKEIIICEQSKDLTDVCQTKINSEDNTEKGENTNYGFEDKSLKDAPKDICNEKSTISKRPHNNNIYSTAIHNDDDVFKKSPTCLERKSHNDQIHKLSDKQPINNINRAFSRVASCSTSTISSGVSVFSDEGYGSTSDPVSPGSKNRLTPEVTQSLPSEITCEQVWKRDSGMNLTQNVEATASTANSELAEFDQLLSKERRPSQKNYPDKNNYFETEISNTKQLISQKGPESNQYTHTASLDQGASIVWKSENSKKSRIRHNLVPKTIKQTAV